MEQNSQKIDVGEDTLWKMKLMKNNNLWTFYKISPFLGKVVLEIGSGLGTMSKFLVSADRDLTLIDIDDAYVEFLNKTFSHNSSVRARKLDVKDFHEGIFKNKFDTIIGINVLEHVSADKEALTNLNKGLASGGRLLLVVPAHKILFSAFDKKLLHHRRYSKKELVDKLKGAGFSVEKVEYMNSLSAIGWFINFRLFRKKSMPVFSIIVADKLIFLVSFIEKYLKIPFGLSLFVVAKKK